MAKVVDVLVLCALKDELDALLCLNNERNLWVEEQVSEVPIHRRTFVNEKGEQFEVAAVRPVDMGGEYTAALGGVLMGELKPDFVAMCGVCAGKEGHVYSGDVIVVERAFSRSRGKEKGGNLERDIKTYSPRSIWCRRAQDWPQEWGQSWLAKRPMAIDTQLRWMLYTVSEIGENAANSPERPISCANWQETLARGRSLRYLKKRGLELTKKGKDWVSNDRIEHPDGPPSAPGIRIHTGAVAVSPNVVEADEPFSEYKTAVRKTIGIEMESVAIGILSSFGSEGDWLVAKGTQDYAKPPKDDHFRGFASTISAAFVLDFLCAHFEPNKPILGQQNPGDAATPKSEFQEHSLPNGLPWDDLGELITVLKEELIPLESGGINELTNRTDLRVMDEIEDKNELNHLSDSYYAVIRDHHEPHAHKIRDFLKKAGNFEYKEMYYEVVEHIRTWLAKCDGDGRSLEEKFEEICQLAKEKGGEQLARPHYLLKPLLSFMYLECSIGRKS